MAEVEMSLPGGLYHEVLALKWVLDDQVDRFSFTVNGPQPTMSRYIAYDTLNPPNPFLAVTQDGRGNVVYDGGFPKFYNMYHNPNAASFAQLNAAGKYLFNALNFCANPKKVAVGNKKWLILGDSTVSDSNYPIKSGGSSGFYYSLMAVARAGGWQVTMRDRADYAGGYLNPNFAELDQYAVVMLMSSFWYGTPGTAWITDAAVTDMVTYREAGNGLIFITDHGAYRNNSLEQSEARLGGFYRTANKVIRNFGSFFNDNFDRSPVNVGFLRRTYGDHALYNGMTNAEYIHAGQSESRINTASYPEYTKDTAPTVHLDQDGRYVISILAIMKDGTTRTFRYLYNVVLGQFLFWRKDGVSIAPEYTTGKSISDFLPYIESRGDGTLIGNILRNGKKIANFTRDDTVGTKFRWLANTDIFPVSDGDIFTISVVTPYSYDLPLKINRYQPDIMNSVDFAKSTKALDYGAYEGHDRKNILNESIEDVAHLFPLQNLLAVGNSARDFNVIRQYSADFVGEDTTAYIYPTTAATEAAKLTAPTTAPCLIDAESKLVYEYVYPEWVIVPGLEAKDFLGAPRIVKGITNNIRFRLLKGGNINRLD